MKNMEKISAETRASVIGMICNLLLAAGKIVAGILTGLLSVLADGVNNLSDCGSSVVALVSFRVAKKPADKEHPYGHRRAEYIASMCIAFLVLVLAVELARESLDKIVAGTESASVWWVYLVLGISVFVKACMFLGTHYEVTVTCGEEDWIARADDIMETGEETGIRVRPGAIAVSHGA